MADADRTSTDLVNLLEQLEEAPYAFDFYQAVRRLDCAYPELPPTGLSTRPADDPVRFSQEASLDFAPATVCGWDTAMSPPRLVQRFFGLLGPQGALPLHLTEYVRNRIRNRKDETLQHFLDMFHHRMLALFYRAWSRVRPTVSFDTPKSDRFSDYVGSLFGLGMQSLTYRDPLPDLPKRHFAGRFALQTRNAEGLLAILSGYFRLPVRLNEFAGHWIELPHNCQCLTGMSSSSLGQSTIVGSHVWDCQSKFRIIMGPLNLDQYYQLLPCSGRPRESTGVPFDQDYSTGARSSVVDSSDSDSSNFDAPVGSREPGTPILTSHPGIPNDLDSSSEKAEIVYLGSENRDTTRQSGEPTMDVPSQKSEAMESSAGTVDSTAASASISTIRSRVGQAANGVRGDSDVKQSSVGGRAKNRAVCTTQTSSLDRLIAAVRFYVGDELGWDLQLILKREETPPLGLGIQGHLGWSSWLLRDHAESDSDDLILDAMQAMGNPEPIEFTRICRWDHTTLGQLRSGEVLSSTMVQSVSQGE